MTAPKKPVVPPPVVRSRTLWIIGSIVAALGVLPSLFDRVGLIEQFHAITPELGQDALDAAATDAVFTGVLGAMLSVMVHVLLANRLLKAANWARIVLCVLTGLGIAGVLVSTMLYASGLAAAIGWRIGWPGLVSGALGALTEIAAISYMFRTEANRWFSTPSTQLVTPGN